MQGIVFRLHEFKTEFHLTFKGAPLEFLILVLIFLSLFNVNHFYRKNPIK